MMTNRTVAGLKLTFEYFPQNISLSGRSIGGKWENNAITEYHSLALLGAGHL